MSDIYPLHYLAKRQSESTPSEIAILERDNYTEPHGSWRGFTWKEVDRAVDRTAFALMKEGISLQDRVGIFSENMKEFFFSDLALLGIRAVGVPLYSSLSASQVEYIIEDSGMKLLFVGHQKQYDVAFPVAEKKRVKVVVYSADVVFQENDRTSVYFKEFLKAGDALPSEELDRILEERRQTTTPQDLAFIIYTSGTTGASKGVPLTHKNLITSIRQHTEIPYLKRQNISMNFLPLTHIFEKMWSLLCLEMGISIAVNTVPMMIMTTMPEIRPHYMCNVPRFWEKVYLGIKEKMNHMPPSLRHLSRDCLVVCKKYQEKYILKGKRPPFFLRLKYALFKKTILKVVKKKIGVDRGLFLPVSGAALSLEIHRFLASIGIPIAHGYGATETTATVSFCMPDDIKLGSVGKALDHLEIKLDTSAGGELLVKGDTIMEGYYNRPEANTSAFTEDGFFRTGDLMHIDEEGYLFFKERSKDLYKTANGKYIAPQVIEGILSTTGILEQALIVADRRNYVSALIYPDWKKLRTTLQIPETTEESKLKGDPKVISFIKEKIDAAQGDLAEYEKVKSFIIIPEPFSIQNGLLTNSLKYKRSLILKHYKKEIDDLYGYAIEE